MNRPIYKSGCKKKQIIKDNMIVLVILFFLIFGEEQILSSGNS